MLKEDFRIIHLLSGIARQEDNDKRLKYFFSYRDLLKDYRMIYVDEKIGIDKTAHLENIANLKYENNSLYSSNKLICINNSAINDMILGTGTILKNIVSISFDVNIVSQLIYCKKFNINDPVLNEVVKLCKSEKCTFDITPYVIENYMKNPNKIGLDKYAIEDIKCFEEMVLNSETESEKKKEIEELINTYNSEDFKPIIELGYNDIYLCELTYLLAIIFIHFKYHKSSAKHKFEKFLEFCDRNIKAFHHCSVNLAKLFYDNPKLRFFRNIEKNNNEIIKTIENMAWDLFHLRFMEKLQTIDFQIHPDLIEVPIFISKDKGLNEIRKAYQIKCLFQNMKSGVCNVFYEMNSINYENDIKYFSPWQVKRRIENRQDFNLLIKDFKKLILEEIKK